MLPPRQFISCLQSIKIKNIELYLEKLEIELETLGRNRKKLIYDRHFLIQSCEIRRYFFEIYHPNHFPWFHSINL